MKQKQISAIILAAGKGTRMGSDLAKVLHPIGGRPMLAYSVDLARDAGAERIVAVIGHQAELVRKTCATEGVVFVEQKQQLGTGHAVLQAKEEFAGYNGRILILCGDVPLLKGKTVSALMAHHEAAGASVTVMTVNLENPGSYGRVVKNMAGEVLKIVEAKDAVAAEKEVREINTGIYCAESPFLFSAVGRIENNNAQHEYYLTDIIEIARRDGCRVSAFLVHDEREVMGINTTADLDCARRLMGMNAQDKN